MISLSFTFKKKQKHNITKIIPKFSLKQEKTQQKSVSPGFEGFFSTSTSSQDCVEHINRIARVLAQPRGNLLLVGVGGSGRSSCAKICALEKGGGKGENLVLLRMIFLFLALLRYLLGIIFFSRVLKQIQENFSEEFFCFV